MKRKDIIIISVCVMVEVLLVIFLHPIIFMFSSCYIDGMIIPKSSDWISFIGSIIGVVGASAISISIFIGTIHHNKKLEIEQNTQNVLPFLTFMQRIDRIDTSESRFTEVTYIELTNVGLNTAVNISCDKKISLWLTKDQNERYLIPPVAVGMKIAYPQEYIIDNIQGLSQTYTFFFENIHGKKYKQEIVIDKNGHLIKSGSPISH